MKAETGFHLTVADTACKHLRMSATDASEYAHEGNFGDALITVDEAADHLRRMRDAIVRAQAGASRS